jgi:cellulose synthase/poly-beta-1,6-N-acetylglucosamine synthase-like glycosyltransferase
MNLMLNILLLTLTGLIAVPVLVLFIECMAARLARKPAAIAADQLPAKIGLLISAHNEELVIEATARSLMMQLRPGDQLTVVADNCTDLTARIARSAGAQVLERNDTTKRGKGYGLAFGVEYLKQNPPDVLVLFDADMVIQPGVVERLALEAARHQRPIQAQYIQQAPPEAGAKGSVSTLAFIVKNAVRPAGLDFFGVPCALTGTGMAFPWSLIESAPLASGHLVEDMELGLHFLRAGKGPKLCSAVTIVGDLPGDSKTAYIQRTRWEHGHLGIIKAHVLPLLFAGFIRFRLDMIASAFDLAVPPLALVVACWGAALMASLAAGFLRHLWLPAEISTLTGIMMMIAILSAWRQHARHLPAQSLLAIPAYIFWKVPLYAKFLLRRQTAWVRTDRTAMPPAARGASLA